MLSMTTVMIGSESPERLVDFYTKVLGDPSWKDGGFVGWQAGPGMLFIGAHSEVKGRSETPGRIILNFETSDVATEFDRIRELGADVVQEPYQPGDGGDSGSGDSGSGGEFWLATFADPDGNYFQLASPMPAS
jgi:predicted enzyme related to lactoylglutathione lyase